MLTRRKLLKVMMLAGGFCLLPCGRGGWALAAPQAAERHLIVILMRGAVDGLSIVTPYTEQAYYHKRSSIALAPPNQTDGLLNLDGFWLAPIHSLPADAATGKTAHWLSFMPAVRRPKRVPHFTEGAGCS